jgi:hypothetical protein
MCLREKRKEEKNVEGEAIDGAIGNINNEKQF